MGLWVITRGHGSVSDYERGDLLHFSAGVPEYGGCVGLGHPHQTLPVHLDNLVVYLNSKNKQQSSVKQ